MDLLDQIMDEEPEKELSIERLLHDNSLYGHCLKFKHDSMKCFFVNIAEQLHPKVKISAVEAIEDLSKTFQMSGSIMEGAAYARNLNPSLPKKYAEAEFDFMIPFAKILKNKSIEIIVDLTYAKGFAWVKYEPGCFALDSSRELRKLLVKHEDGNTYVNAKAARRVGKSDLNLFIPDLHWVTKYQIQGPSSNIESTASDLKIPSKTSVNDPVKTLYDCALFIEGATVDLKKFHEHVLSKLKELENVTQTNSELISITEIEELASLILPSNKERKNLLLQVHWILLAFFNKMLSTILTVERLFINPDILENLGMVRYWCTPLFSDPKILSDSINSYLKYLLNIFPAEVLQKYKKEPPDGLSYFFQKCFFCQQNIVEGLFRFLDNCKRESRGKCQHLKILPIHDKNNPNECGYLREMCLNIDQVPVIVVEDWPNIAREWVNRGRLWPSLSLIKDVVKRGCYIVPKPYYGHKNNDLLDWRWSFSLAEMILATARTKEMDLSYLVLKSIFYRYLKPVEFHDKTLISYLIKTVMLWQCEKNDENWWSERSTVNYISVLLNKVKESFYNKHLCHYFIRDINLFDDVDDELILYGQAILESICADPIVCMEEVVKKLVGNRSEKGSTTTLTNDLEKLSMPLMLSEFQESIKALKEKCQKGVPTKWATAINTLQTFFEEVMPQLFPGVTEVQAEHASGDSEINIDEMVDKIKRGISDTFDISLD